MKTKLLIILALAVTLSFGFVSVNRSKAKPAENKIKQVVQNAPIGGFVIEDEIR